MARFSERVGASSPRTLVQLKEMDAALRNGLWNVLIDRVLHSYTSSALNAGLPYRKLWEEFFRKPVDTIPFRDNDARAAVRAWYFDSASWWEVYDLLQFCADLLDDKAPSAQIRQTASSLRVPGIAISPRETYCRACNVVLERELSGYRFVSGVLIPIADDAQRASIEAALQGARAAPFAAVRAHIDTALRLFGDRQAPSHRNVVKEAISAVEAVVQVVASKPGATLGDALKRLDEKTGIHPALVQGFQKIYGYTSDSGGIRHALSDEATVEQEDAQFMLVSCSAFVTYLIAKSRRAGIVT